MNTAMKETRNPAWPLIFATHATAGLFFAYETAGALGPDLAAEMGFTDHQIGLLYSAYSIPAFVSIFANGYLNKKLGSPKCVVLLSFIIALGVSIIAAAPNFIVMFIGQLIYGSGASPMFVTLTFITGKWFGTDAIGKRKLSLAVGLQFAWMRFHSFAAFVSLPLIAELDFRVSLCTASFVCWSCFASGVIFYFIDRTKKFTDNLFDAVELKDMSEAPEGINFYDFSDTENDHVEDDIDPTFSDVSPRSERQKEKEEKEETEEEVKVEVSGDATLSATLTTAEKAENADSVDLEKALVVTKNVEEGEEGEEVAGMGKKWTKDGKDKKWYQIIITGYRTIRSFSLSYWLVLSLMVLFTCDLYTTTAFLTKFLVDTEIASSNTMAADITSLVCLANVLTSPLAGWLSGYTGWRVKYLILGSVNLVLIHSLFAFANPAPAIILASAMGLTQSIMDTNLWPALIFTVPKKDYPFASSLVTLSYNLGLIIFPTFCGMLKDTTGSWLSVNLAFMTVSCCAVILSCVLKFVDSKQGSMLDLPFIKRPVKG